MSVKHDEFDTVWAPPNRAVDDQGATYDTVQAAQDNARDHIMVGPGMFGENVVIDTDGLTVRATGRSTVIDGGSDGPALTVAASDVDVDRVSARTDTGEGTNSGLYAFDVEDGASNVRLMAVRAINSSDDGIRIVGEDATVVAPYIENTDSIGILMAGSSDGGSLVAPQVLSAGSVGARLDGQRNSIVGGTVKDTGSTGIFSAASGAKVNDVNVHSVYGAGIQLSADSTDAVVVGNHISDWDTGGNDRSAFEAADSIDPTVRGNSPDSVNNGASGSVTDADWVSRLVDSPNGTIENVALSDGDSAEITIPVVDGETLEVFRWGAYRIDDGTTPGGLDMQIKDGGDAVQASENTGNTESTDPSAPVASHQNASGGVSIFKIAVNNGTGGEIADPGVGAFAAYQVS